MNPPIFVIGNSRAKYVLMLIASIGFVAGGKFIVAHATARHRLVGWMPHTEATSDMRSGL